MCKPDLFVVESHLAALRLIEEEGLEGMQGVFLVELALCYAALGEEEEFRKWAGRAVEFLGERQPEAVEELRGWLVHPGGNKRWGWRRRERMRKSTVGFW